MPVPPLLDEIIGHIFSHLSPQTVGLFGSDNLDLKALKQCSLVSHQFGFWARHGRYRKIVIREPSHLSHYLDLCRRYSDMPSHIKTVEISLYPPRWQDPERDIGYDNLILFLDLMASKGSVQRCHFQLMNPCSWDFLKLDLQKAILRFLLSHRFDMLELGGVCLCFPFMFLPILWMSKRFYISNLDMSPGEDNEGNFFIACPAKTWEKEGKMQDGLSCREVKKQLRETIKHATDKLHENGAIHLEKTALESLWIPSEAVILMEPHLNDISPDSYKLRELQFKHVHDDAVPLVVGLIKACMDTLESLCLLNINVRSATSSHLSLLSDVSLPRLHTLTVMTHMENSGEPTKSMAWYLLHLKNSKTLPSLKTINLMFLDTMMHSGPMTLAGSTRNVALIKKLFDVFQFFKLEKVLADIFAAGNTNTSGSTKGGMVTLWFMLSSFPGPMEDTLVNEGIKREFPNLLRERRITGSVGEFDEPFKIADALSIFPEGPAQTRHQAASEDLEKVLGRGSRQLILNSVMDQFRQLGRI